MDHQPIFFYPSAGSKDAWRCCHTDTDAKSGLDSRDTSPVAGSVAVIAFMPRANAQDERKHSYATLLIQQIDPSITFRALGTAVGSLLREHISSTQSRSAGITRIAGARSHQTATQRQHKNGSTTRFPRRAASLNQLGRRTNDHAHRRGTAKAHALEDAAAATRTAPVKEVATT